MNIPAGAFVQGINDEGQIVGWDPSQNGGLGGGFLMTAAGELLQINVPGANGTRAEGINDIGDVVGIYYDASNNEHGFRTTVSSVGVVPVFHWIGNNADWSTGAFWSTGTVPGGNAVVAIDEPRGPFTHRADYERARDRGDRLMAELLTATAALMAAKEATARLEGEFAAWQARPWWRRLAG